MRAARAGMTLVEVLVSLAIVGVLLSLLIPATMSARESARSAACRNNLRQLGVAAHAHEAARRSFPTWTDQGGYSLHSKLLPYMEMTATFNSINFGEAASETEDATGRNATATCLVVATFLCPSDGRATRGTGATNYLGNRGFGYDASGGPNNGAFSDKPISIATFTDGLGATAMIAESLIGGVEASRATFVTPIELLAASQIDDFADECRTARSPAPGEIKGSCWMMGDFTKTDYNHVLPPNANTCLNGQYVQQGAWTAGSQHRNGANILYADGSVRKVTETVVLTIWRATGTRNGREMIGSN